MKSLNKWYMHKQVLQGIFFFLIAVSALLFTGCGKDKIRRVAIWTNCQEFAPYIELFNKTHTDIKILLYYKENPANILQRGTDEKQPDIIAGPWLRTEKTTHYFHPLYNLFDRNNFPVSAFYPQLLDAGKVNHTQYLLPVSFNLPAVIFSTTNQEQIGDSYMISLDQIKKAGAAFNRKNKDGLSYSRIGFTPQSTAEFLYLTAKLKDAQFHKTKTAFAWNQDNLSSAVSYIHSWTKTFNTSAQTENDFAYKYLSMPSYRQVTTGRCLFSYIKSDQLFILSSEQTEGIDYRWIEQDKKIPIEDSLIMIGITKKSRNKEEAKIFIKWFLNANTQHDILEHKAKMKLDTDTFGIAGGFSSLKEVNEHILPMYYTMLLSNIPQAETLKIPEKLPPRWDSIRDHVVKPYLKQACSAEKPDTVERLEDRLTDWTKQNFN
jgi:ABC-type glycerol-3-phosphate transport system substrate-binding protein